MIDITFVQTVQNGEIQPLSSCKTPGKNTEMINREVKTRGLFTHSQPSAINYNLHNTSHNEAPISRLVFSTCFDDVFRGNNGDIPYEAALVVNAGCIRMPDCARGIEWCAPDCDRQAGSVSKRCYYMRLKDRKISVSGIAQRYFLNSYDIAKHSYT